MNTILDIRSTEEILREQIKDLTALLDLKNKRIVELEALQTIPHLTPVQPLWTPNLGQTITLTEEQAKKMVQCGNVCSDCKCGA